MVQQIHCSAFHVQTGLMMIVSKITHFMVQEILHFFCKGNASLRILVSATDSSRRLIVGFSSIPNFQVRLPADHENVSILNMIIHIRDTFDCVTEYNMSSVSVQFDSGSVSRLINNLKGSTNEINSNPFIRSLYGGNQNIIGQIITSLSQQFNRINMENIRNAASSKCRQ